MAIRIKTPPEPLSENSFLVGTPASIQSDASRLLTQELRRYCAGDVNGRSFLISGHRGAGKTTLVASAFLTVLAESKQKPQELLRPLMVPLHGPNLLPDPRRARRRQPSRGDKRQPHKNAGDKGAQTEPADEGAKGLPRTSPARPSASDLARDDTDPETQAALVQITLALHRAVCRQMAEHYRDHVLARAKDPYSRRSRSEQHADHELAAQLDLELYQWPTAMRLREFWQRAGALPGGVLSFRPPPDQGLRELVALTAVCDSYRRISGTLSQTERGSESGTQTLEASIAANAAGKDFYGPLISVLTGGAVATGLATAGVPPTAATFAGAVGALASAMTLKASASRSRTRTRTREDNFLFDLSVTTLDRVLPMLIDALLRCGLAPLFVVDELDKVVDLKDRMIGMVHHLKKLVAERAFFCFLTDRLYFEQLQQLSHDEAFPPEYTYFTHRLFVVFRPPDMHRYLLEHVFSDPNTPATTLPSTPSSAPAAPAPNPSATATSPDEQDRQVLPFVVLHRARMHPIDMQREIAQLRSDTGEVNLPVGRVRSSNVFGFDVLIQVAIETVLRGSRVADELERDPAVYRVAYDAMYHLSRLWNKDGRQPVDLREENWEAFDKDLDDRIGHEDPTRSLKPAGTAGAARSEKGQKLQIPQAQKRLLFGCVQELARLLSDPEVMQRHLDPAVVPEPVFATVSRLLALDPPLLEETERGLFEWCYDPAGRKLRPSRHAARAIDSDRDADSVEKVDGIIRKLVGESIGLDAMSSRYGILPSSPAWPQVEQAITRLRRFEGLAYPEQQDDERVLAEYATMLAGNVETLGRALLSAAAVGSVTRMKGRQAQLAEGLRTMSEWYALQSQVRFQVSTTLQQCWQQLKEEYALDVADPPATIERFHRVRDQPALLNVSGVMDAVPPVTSVTISRAWQSVAARIMDVAAPVNDVPELMCAAAQVGPSKHLRNLPHIAWSDLLAASLEDVERHEDERVPVWMAPVALRVLGFDPEAGHPFPVAVPAESLYQSRKIDPVPEFLESATLGAPSLPASLIVKTGPNSLVKRLATGRLIPMVALTQKQLQQAPLVGYLARVQQAARMPLFHQLVVEMPADPHKAEEAAAGVLTPSDLPPREIPKLFLYATQPGPDAPKPQLIAPTSLDQILPAGAA